MVTSIDLTDTLGTVVTVSLTDGELANTILLEKLINAINLLSSRLK